MRTKTVVPRACVVGNGGEVTDILSLDQGREQGIWREIMNV